MSWLKIDDGFEDHPKVEPLSDAAHRLWSRAACWCKKPTNAHTNGFVPRAMLRTIAKNSAPQKKLEKLAQELVDAKAGGMFEVGLWEPEEGGWRFHDWAEYQPGSGETGEPSGGMSRSEAARVAGLRSAEVRRAKHGTAQPRSNDVPSNVPERPPNDSGTFERTSPTTFDDVRPNDVRRTASERPEPPDPDPRSRSQISKEDGRKSEDLTGFPREEPADTYVRTPDVPSEWDGSGREQSCPLDLLDRARRLGVVAQLADKLKQPEAVIEDAFREFVSYWTIGAGMGRTKRFWMREARERIRRRASDGQLKPPGAVEHESHSEPAQRLSESYLAAARARVDARIAKAKETQTEDEAKHG